MGKWVGGLVVLVALGLGAFAVVRHRRLSRELVDEVIAMSAPRPRLVHREPAIDSTFEAQLVPLLDAPPAWGAFSPSAPEALQLNLRDVGDGRLPFEKLDPVAAADAALTRPWVEKLMACSRASATGGVDGFGPFADWDHPRMQVSWYVPLLRWGALEVRRHLAGGDPRAALRWCADLMANARDVALARGLLGLGIATTTARGLAAPCEDALRAVPSAERAEFHAEFERVLGSMPSVAEVLRHEQALMGLMLFGRHLTAVDVARVPLVARPSVGTLAEAEPLRRFGLYLTWGDYHRSMRTLIDAADAPDRDPRFRAELADVGVVQRLLGETPSTTFLEMAQRHDELRTLLERLSRPLPAD